MSSFGSKDTECIWHEQYVKRVDRTVNLEVLHAANGVDGVQLLASGERDGGRYPGSMSKTIMTPESFAVA